MKDRRLPYFFIQGQVPMNNRMRREIWRALYHATKGEEGWFTVLEAPPAAPGPSNVSRVVTIAVGLFIGFLAYKLVGVY